jgi:hypothetical protein
LVFQTGVMSCCSRANCSLVTLARTLWVAAIGLTVVSSTRMQPEHANLTVTASSRCVGAIYYKMTPSMKYRWALAVKCRRMKVKIEQGAQSKFNTESIVVSVWR